MDFVTYPDARSLAAMYKSAPKFMRPNMVPIAVSVEGFLAPEECNEIIIAAEATQGYKHQDCNALTRELGHLPSLELTRVLAMEINSRYFGYHLDNPPHSWLQTYGSGDNYQMHMDGAPGQMRKLTAVALLSDEKNYDGGELEIRYHPASWKIPRTKGTVVVFPPWIMHKVHLVTAGHRQTINMGFWGPNFR